MVAGDPQGAGVTTNEAQQPPIADVDPAARSRRLLEEQIRLLLRQAGSGVAAAAIGALLLTVPLLRSVPPLAVAAWVVCLFAGYMVRQRLMQRAQAQGSLERVRRVALVGSAVLGVIVTAPAPLFYAACSAETRALLSMIQLVWMTAAISVLAVFPLSYKLYSAFSLANIALGWWLSSAVADAALVSALMIPLWLLLARFSDRVGKLIEESVDIRHERESLVEQLRRALADLEEAQASRSRFLAAASHDLLQPVHALLLLTGLSRDLRDGRRLQQLHEQIHTVAGSIESMFRGLLDLARFEAGTLHATPQAVALRQVLDTIRAEYEERCIAKGIRLELRCAPELAAHTDLNLCARVLRNLVDNAVKFTASGGVTLEARREAGLVIVTVSDTGVGIAAEDLSHVRMPFYRGSAARELDVPGVGLGLATSSQIVQVLGGELSMASSQGTGTVVAVKLPAAQAEAAFGRGERDEPSLLHRVIAVVEDNRQAREAMTLWLQENGCQVAAAADAGAVIAECEARRLRPEFVLADFSLGRAGNGIEAIRALRSHFGPLPAAIVSGDPLRPEQIPNDVPLLKKPLRPEALRQLLQGAWA
jgi:two-component system, sensor histidine kinase